ncbi:MAG TPA: FAD-dependent monooxygenase [Streptosporangiaceae bacterium]|nr:FAD-dependent monooxygenase [Streptosporangiaceae bacterium]
MNDADVLIAGGGPVGLMLACELSLAGTRPLVLERRDSIDATIKTGSINVATVEVLYRRGLLPAVRAEQERVLAGPRPAAARGPVAGGQPGAGGRSGASGRPDAGDRSGASGRPSSDRRSVPRLAGHFAGLWYRGAGAPARLGRRSGAAGRRDALHHWFGEPASSPAAGPPGPAPVPSNRFPKLGPWTIAR